MRGFQIKNRKKLLPVISAILVITFIYMLFYFPGARYKKCIETQREIAKFPELSNEVKSRAVNICNNYKGIFK
jgi:hypothetical protein